jgi:hypothetical protein
MSDSGVEAAVVVRSESFPHHHSRSKNSESERVTGRANTSTDRNKIKKKNSVKSKFVKII